ncbi:MAG: hypothetical protein HFI10_10310 [Lachnospiraceae bacterium]|jgi:hypothetical protein|nr:hypothetical protein [Lachnospiraceae bacterium]
MRPEYDGVKFYSVYDWSIGEHLEKASIILESFDENEEYLDINKVIELYNIQELINSGCTLNDWDEAKIVHYKKICDSFERIFGKFFGKMSDENFKQICQSICIGYVEDFWKLFVQFGTFKKVSGKAFASYLNEPETTLYKLLQQKELVKAYDKEFAEVLRISEQTPRLIIGKFLQKHDHGCSYSFPKELSPLEYEGILQRYIKLETANLNDLQLLAYSQSSKECPISDKLRLSAKRACETYWENRPFTGVEIGYGMGVEFADVSEIKSAKRLENNTYQITYDIKWLLDNLDYPTILNNFRYIFEQFDECWRSTLVSVESQLSSFEKMISTRGIKEFIKGNHFNMGENISTMQVKGCYDILKQNGVRLEDVLKWFFEEYLPQEFGVYGFRFNPPSEDTTMVEKCRTIASEMDGVLKQFRMYVQDGEIDRELFEMSSEHIRFSSLSGFVKEKYAYENSDDIKKEQFLLFSDQSLLGCIRKTQDRYSRFVELMTHEDVEFSDFWEHQQKNIRWLIERDIVEENADGHLKLNIAKVFVLKDLYEHDVICPQYYSGKLKNIINEWCKNGDLRLSDSLFSEPEQNYLNYELNKSAYSNGLDLRNKYAHSTYPEDEKIQVMDYIVLLKIMILVVTKINEEFCLKEQIEATSEK